MVEAQPDGPNRAATGMLLVAVSARLTRLYGRVLGQLDIPLTFRQHRTLMRVHQGHRSMAALAAFGNLTLPTVSESVDALVRRGLMRRAENPDDRRSTLLELTPLGETANEAAQASLTRVADDLLADVPEDVRVLLHGALESVYASATTHFLADRSADPTPPRRRPAEGRRATTGRPHGVAPHVQPEPGRLDPEPLHSTSQPDNQGTREDDR
ncbi:MarR family winged helix-turn-helix transcriptional regulator [Geodermatophilus sabuli]|nr:MarR family transcriptional regulator [Geodermatophilus sabuli]